MDTWVWLVIVAAVVVVLFALAWRSSGRAKARSRGPENSLTSEQLEQINLLALRNRTNQPPFIG
jgi:membrane protein implicated in regulation of membrane protease activity